MPREELSPAQESSEASPRAGAQDTLSVSRGVQGAHPLPRSFRRQLSRLLAPLLWVSPATRLTTRRGLDGQLFLS